MDETTFEFLNENFVHVAIIIKTQSMRFQTIWIKFHGETMSFSNRIKKNEKFEKKYRKSENTSMKPSSKLKWPEKA